MRYNRISEPANAHKTEFIDVSYFEKGGLRL